MKTNGGPPEIDFANIIRPIEVVVEGSSREDLEIAMKKFKGLFNRERVIRQLKEKSYYEKPSIKKRRKRKEARERQLLAEARERMVKTGEWEKRQKKKARKKIQKEERKAESSGVF